MVRYIHAQCLHTHIQSNVAMSQDITVKIRKWVLLSSPKQTKYCSLAKSANGD